ncbi:MAG TPA: SpoIIE family protein phosphatase [Acidobacteriota bacterium]|nr:SpoIIE family protein phosphatase [Acidobacteriota bacterium]
MNVELLKTLTYFLTGGFLIFLAITVTRDNISNRINRITGAMLFFAGFGPISMALGAILLQDTSAGQPLDQTAFYNLYLAWEFFFPLLVVFSLHFPIERLRTVRRPRLILVILIPQLMHLLLVLSFRELSQIAESLSASAAEGGFLSIILGPLSYLFSRLVILLGLLRTYEQSVFGTINVFYVVVAVYLLEAGRRYVTNPRLLSQTSAVLWGTRLGLGLYILSYLVTYVVEHDLGDSPGTLLRIGAMTTGAGFFAYAIVRHQFLDVRLVFRQSLIYTFASTLLVGTYVFLALRSQELLTPIFGERAQTVSYVFIVLLLLVFPPISNWIDNVVRSMFMRTRTDYRYIMERFSRQVISVFDPVKLRQSIQDTLKTALLIDNVYFVLYDDGVGEYAILQSDDYPRRTVIDRDDLMLRGINLLDRPTNFGSLGDYEKDSQLASILHQMKIRLILPMKDAQHLLGFLALTSKAAGYRYTPEDYNLLGVLSNQMVTALTNARLYADSLEKIRLEEEVSMARQIQLDLLPDHPPQLPGSVIVAQSTPSRTVGGDFYDFITIAEQKRVGVVIADASGKGMPAALLIAQVQAIIRCEVNNGNPISTMMENMNQQIVHSTSAEKYVTLFYGEIDSDSDVFHYANAGHNYPILVRANGDVELLDEGGPIIGALSDMKYTSASVQLRAEDILFLFTDGLSEAMNSDGEEYGETRIRDHLVRSRSKDPRTIVDDLMRDVRGFDPTYPPQDDTTIVAMKITDRR